MGPIFRSLMKSRLGAALIVLQIAMTVAVLANVVSIVKDRLIHINRSSGLAEKQIAGFDASALDFKSDPLQRIEAERAELANLPDLESLSFVNSLPLSSGGWSLGLQADLSPKAKNVNIAVYMGPQDLRKTLGVDLIEGRDFDAREITSISTGPLDPKVVILTESVAKQLFPNKSAVGERVTLRGDADSLGTEVIGVVKDFARPWVSAQNPYDSVLVPFVFAGGSYNVLIRAKAGADALAVAKAARDRLAKAFRQTVYSEEIDVVSELRKRAYSSDFTLTVLISSFAVLLLGVTVLGMIGLASFWVNQRTRTIGVRRALGARKIDIERYFRMENLLLTGLGSGLGLLLAYALNYFLSKHANMAMLPIWPALVGVLVLILVGQLAVTRPARTASMIPPALATRAA